MASKFYNLSTDNTLGGNSPSDYLAPSEKAIKEYVDNNAGGASPNIGEIVASTIPLTDAGLHLLDGTQLSGSGIYSAFVDYIGDLYDSGDYTDIFETEANWQTAVTTYGVCGKFVYDSVNNTVRLPLITGFTEGTITPSTLGDLTEAGLPNITGAVQGIKSAGDTAINSALYKSGYNYDGNVSTSSQQFKTLSLDASLSNPIYGNSTTVQPQSIKVLYYIVVATSTKTDIQVDIDEIATDLNGKVDKSSLVELDLQEAVVCTEMYVNGTTWWEVYSNGYCRQGDKAPNNNPYTAILLKPLNVVTSVIATGIPGSNAVTPPQPQNGYVTGTSVKFIGANHGGGFYWEVDGYLA